MKEIRRGAPKKDIVKPHCVNLRFTEDQFKLISKVAEQEMRCPTDLIRVAVIKYCQEKN